jgi:hypothetical protein
MLTTSSMALVVRAYHESKSIGKTKMSYQLNILENINL